MATMAAKYGGKNGSFSASIGAFAENTVQKIDEIFRDIVIEIGETVIRLSPVDTGRFKGNWQFTIDQPANASLNNYDKVGTETIADLVSKANKLESGQTAWIVNNLVYSIPLEYGHSKQAPTGMVRVTLARFQQIVADAVKANQ